MILDEWLAKFLYPHPGCLRVDHCGRCGLVGRRREEATSGLCSTLHTHAHKYTQQLTTLSHFLLPFLLLRIIQQQILRASIMIMNTFAAIGLYFMSYTSYQEWYINRCNT